jgi:ankyrin repeat protein
MKRRQLLLAGCAATLFSMAAPTRAGAFEDWFDAARHNRVKSAQSLLQRGFDINAAEPGRGETALMLALREKATDVFSYLLARPGLNLEQKAANGDTALMIAAWTGNLPAVKALIEKGAEVNRPGWAPLHYAAGNGKLDVISLLLEHHAYIDAESPNRTTPLMMAAWQGHIYAVKLLLDEGADPSLRNDKGMDVIDFARHGEHPDIVQGLIHRRPETPGK